MARFILFLTALYAFAACTPSLYKGKSKVLAEMISENLAFANNFTGVVLLDSESKETILDINGGKYFTPASNIKLITFYTTSQVLKDSIPAMEYMEVGDSLIFWGTGDPTFLHPNFGFQPAFDFLQKSNKQLFFYPKFYKDEHFGPGWAWDDYQDYYSVERSAFPIFGNHVRFAYSSSSRELVVQPDFFRKFTHVSEDTLKYSREISRLQESNSFVYLSKPLSDFEADVPFKYSDSLFISLLSDTLNKPIYEINGLPDKKVQMIKGYPVDSIYIPMLHESDNFLAEQLIIMASSQMFDSLSSWDIIKHSEGEWLNDLPQKPRWVDGSGLSRYNLATPNSMVKLLAKMLKENDKRHLFDLLPSGGESGTIQSWYGAENPFVYAKSGTLSNNYSLSGYLLTGKGNTLIFSIMTNHYMQSTPKIRQEIEGILKYVRDTY